ncbi:VWA domain-containing protein, partial [Candidatus Bathyarchaeota archaeon]|nr:VWA domain-containing protein [Candidatus Bathyarchaeota archaeon]
MKKNSDIMKIKLTTTIFTLLILTIFTTTFDTVPAVAQDDELTVTKTASPTNIWVGGGSPDTFTVEINVTGYGGVLEETLPIDVVYAIDSSENMIWNDPSNLRIAAAKNFTDMLDPTRDQAGVVSWDLGIDFTYGLTNDFAALKTQIDAVNASGGSDPDLGLEHAIIMLDANTRVEDSVEVIIFLSDGDQSPEQGTYTPSGSNGSYTDEAASKGYLIFSIYLVVEGGSGEENLMDMAQGTGGVYYSSPTIGNLEAIFDEIFETIVIDTSPYDVDVVEVTETYIVDEDNFGITPDSIVEIDGKTEITWLNVAQHVGNNDNHLSADETFSVSFSAKVADEPVAEIFFVGIEHGSDYSTWKYDVYINGGHYPNDQYHVDVEDEAVVNYYDYEENPLTINIPQVYITINEPPCYWILEWCGGYESIESASHSYIYGDDGDTGIHGIRFEYPLDQKNTNVTYWFTLVGDYDEGLVNVGVVRGIGGDNTYLTSVDGPVWTYNIAPEYVFEGLDPTETYMTANATTDLAETHDYGASSVTFKWYGPFEAPSEIPGADPDRLKADWTYVDSDGSD